MEDEKKFRKCLVSAESRYWLLLQPLIYELNSPQSIEKGIGKKVQGLENLQLVVKLVRYIYVSPNAFVS